MLRYEIGNLLDAPVDYICHQVNCQGRMGSGIAGQIRERWPKVYSNYMERYYLYADCHSEQHLLGEIGIVDVKGKCVVNMFGQLHYGYDGDRYTSYDAFWSCLMKIKSDVPEGSKIGFPWGIGCGLGGANWEVISTMIDVVLGDEYEVYIYKLEEK